MTLTSQEVVELFDPWPCRVPLGVAWKLRIAKPWELASYLCFWKVDGAKAPFVTMEEALIKVQFEDWRNQRHMIHGMVRKGHIPRVVIILDRIVIDGNHGLLSLLLRKYDRPIIVVEGQSKGYKASRKTPPRWWGMGP